jgi:hypothetical protein
MTSFDDERKALTLLKVIYEERLLSVNERLKYLDKVIGEEDG